MGLTAPSGAPARDIAFLYLKRQAESAGLSIEDIDGVYLLKEYSTEHNGVRHFVYKQQFGGIEVWNSDFTINIDADGQVLNSGGQLYPRPAANVRAPGIETAIATLDRVLDRLSPSRKGKFRATRRTVDPILRTFRFVRDGAVGPVDSVDGDPVWYPMEGTLRPAWMFYITDDNGVDRWAAPADSETGLLYTKQNLTLYQQPAQARGRVFTTVSPQPNPSPGTVSTAVRAYVDRSLQPLAGDAKASPKGWVSGNATAGNNAVAAPNPFGITFNPAAVPVSGVNGVFDFPLQLGPGAPNPAGFVEAEVTNLFYWTNLAHDSFYASGFDEAAGAYQADNFGKGGVDGDPMYAFSQFGSQASGNAALNNAFYTTTRSNEDGSQGSINMYIGGSGQGRLFTDGSYDAEVITHEYTHGVSTRLVRQLGTQQGGSMGEAWSDFYSLEFTLPAGAPADGVYTEGDYLFQAFGVGIRTRPYTTNLKLNPLSYAQYGSVANYPEVHADGEIWMESLWDVRANLIEQFGDKEGRRRVRMIVLDGMKLSPPSPTMVDMRDAILLADRVDFKGASQSQIWKAFAKRGLGALAYSIDPNSTFIAASFALPSPAGQLRFYQDEMYTGEPFRVVLQDSDLTADRVMVQLSSTSGDLEDLLLTRTGGIYYGSMSATTGAARQRNNILTAIPGDTVTASYNDADTGNRTAGVAMASVNVRQGYTWGYYLAPQPRYTFNPERALFGFPTSANSIRVELPFDFPFYGVKRRFAWVSTDGLISFGTPEPFNSPCPSHGVLGSVPAIAPAFTNVLIGLSPKQDVFMSSGIDFVTFHWVGQTQPNFGQLQPQPVDFNATLFDDGHIWFQYSPDMNQQILSDRLFSQAYGCETIGPVVGISPGHGGNYTVATNFDQLQNLSNAGTVLFIPPFLNSTLPTGVLEAPAAGDKVKDLLTVSGVAGDSDGIAGVDILVDGMMRGTVSASGNRPDFCAAQKIPGCPFVGFSGTINLTAIPLAPGTHSVQVHARNYHGGITTFPDQPVPFTVDGTPSRMPVGAIESPTDGASVTGNARVSGYVYSPDLRVTSVTVLVDGISYAPASLVVSRPDICGALPAPAPPNCPLAGFQLNLNTASTGVWLPNGDHKMQLRVQDSLGRITVLPDTPVKFTVTNPDIVPSKGVLETPGLGDTLSGMVDLKGYAYSAGGRVTSVTILLDGNSVGTLTYGGARPEVCAGLTDVTACPNVGFSGQLDTRRFPNGPHVLGVRIANSTGATTIVPALARNGMSVTIQN